MAKKIKKEEDLKNIKEPVFNIHRMPKGYKSGGFDLLHHKKNKTDNPEIAPEKIKNNKKLGVIIISLGILIILFLIYLAFSSIAGSGFSISGIFNFKKQNINENNNIVLPDNQQSIGDDDFLDEELVGDENNDSSDQDDSSDVVENPITPDELIYTFVDSDEDGLSDDEEFVLGTNHQLVDTDGDGFSDLVELSNLYNPMGPGTLLDNINIDKYENKSFSYSILHPKSWEKRVLSDESSIFFSIDESSFIQILVEKNEAKFSIKDWYANRFMTLLDDSKIIKNNKWEGLYSEDSLAFYLTDNKLENVYTILYTFPENRPNSYINIFNAMVKSFSLK